MLSSIIKRWTNSKLYISIDARISEKYRSRLRNNSFSILCSNCIGGIIYHRLGMPFLSPTINLHLSNPDFVYLCTFLDTYLQQEITFIETDLGHPVGILPGDGDSIPPVKLYFNHSKTNEEAGNDWNRRKQRLNIENLFLIMYNLDEIPIETIKKLESVPCRNKVIFTAVPLPSIPWSCCIRPNRFRKNAECYIDRDLFGRRTFEKHFDFVSWLNQPR